MNLLVGSFSQFASDASWSNMASFPTKMSGCIFEPTRLRRVLSDALEAFVVGLRLHWLLAMRLVPMFCLIMM